MYRRERSCSNPLQKLQKSRTLHRLSRNNPSLVNPLIFTYRHRQQIAQEFIEHDPMPMLSEPVNESEEIGTNNNSILTKTISPNNIPEKSNNTGVDTIVPIVPSISTNDKKPLNMKTYQNDTSMINDLMNSIDPAQTQPKKTITYLKPRKATCGMRRPEAPQKKKKERFHASDLHKQIWEKHMAHKEEQKKFGFKVKPSCGCS